MSIDGNVSASEDDGTFYFESDHLPLRGNRDYSTVLRTIAILEAQKIQVHKQLEDLSLAKYRYLEDPEMFIQKLQKNEAIISPNYISIIKIPEIGSYDLMQTVDIDKIKTEVVDEDVKPTLVRGRIIDETKPNTFNRLWTCEEQRRLEELLIEYPPEAVEMRRYAKIAKALGNRTLQQVSSRVQKYFLKLHDAGLPVPGRKPKSRRVGQNRYKCLKRPTTFFPAYNVPVQMPEDENSLDMLSKFCTDTPQHSDIAEVTDDNNISGSVAANAHVVSDEINNRVVDMLKAIRDEKIETVDGYNPDPMAAKCEVCDIAPVSRTNWYCNNCFCYINQCADCLAGQLIDNHFEHIAHDVVNESGV